MKEEKQKWLSFFLILLKYKFKTLYFFAWISETAKIDQINDKIRILTSTSSHSENTQFVYCQTNVHQWRLMSSLRYLRDIGRLWGVYSYSISLPQDSRGVLFWSHGRQENAGRAWALPADLMICLAFSMGVDRCSVWLWSIWLSPFKEKVQNYK